MELHGIKTQSNNIVRWIISTGYILNRLMKPAGLLAHFGHEKQDHISVQLINHGCQPTLFSAAFG
jgi:hypothetical protein